MFDLCLAPCYDHRSSRLEKAKKGQYISMYDEHNYRNTVNRNEGKLQQRNFLQRNRVMLIIIAILLLLVLVFASTTFLLLTSRPKDTAVTIAPTPTTQSAPTSAPTPLPTPTPEATPTPTPELNPTVSTSQPSTSSISTSTKNYQFICLTHCDDKLDVVLNSITINTTNKTMAWNLSITNNGPVCSYMRGGLSLSDPSGNSLNPDGGTLLSYIAVNSNQTLPRTATFSSIPQQGIQYTATLTTNCSILATYQSVLFSY